MIDRQAKDMAAKAYAFVKEVQGVCDDFNCTAAKMPIHDEEPFWLGIGLLLAGEYRLVELHREPTEEYPAGYIRLRQKRAGEL